MVEHGLVIVPDFVSPELEAAVLEFLGERPIVPGKERNRVLRCGPGVALSGYTIGEIHEDVPDAIVAIGRQLLDLGLIARPPNAISVNEYLPGQGLGFHTDAEVAGDVISIVALAGSSPISFRRWDTQEVHHVPFARRALVQLAGPCRSDPWQHAVLSVTERRVSIVFRCVAG